MADAFWKKYYKNMTAEEMAELESYYSSYKKPEPVLEPEDKLPIEEVLSNIRDEIDEAQALLEPEVIEVMKEDREILKKIQFKFCDLQQGMIDAWNQVFADYPNIEIIKGDALKQSSKEIIIENGEEKEITHVMAITSSANSDAWLGGGIDGAIRDYHDKIPYKYRDQEGKMRVIKGGTALQNKLTYVKETKYPEKKKVPVGEAMIVVIPVRGEFTYLICAPTMWSAGMNVSKTNNANLAMKGILNGLVRANRKLQNKITKVIICGLGTSIGSMPFNKCARQMYRATYELMGDPRYEVSGDEGYEINNDGSGSNSGEDDGEYIAEEEAV